MKLDLMEHQDRALERMDGRDYFALFCEQGTGKTIMVLADVERVWNAEMITGLLVIAPKGVQTNWARREIPKCFDEDMYSVCVFKPGVKYFTRQYDEMQRSETRLKILCINIDAAVSPRGFAVCLDFLKTNRAYMVVDESQRIKNPYAKRTQQVTQLGNLANVKRIATGTAATNSPADVFSQFQFMKKGLLETNSYRAFVAEYTWLLPEDNNLVMHIIDQKAVPIARGRAARDKSKTYEQHLAEARIKQRKKAPQIPIKDDLGNPTYRRLEQLNQLIMPHSFRVRKKDCLDLPEKIYKIFDFELTPRQRASYDSMKNDLRIQLEEDGEWTTTQKLAAGTKLQQIRSNFMLVEGEAFDLAGDNPALDLAKELITDYESQFIVWCKFTHEILQISALMDDLGISSGIYHGATKPKEREELIDAFQGNEVRCFIGQPKAGGVGLTLTNAEDVLYYSNDFSLEDRWQTEDRCHRIGTKHHVTYTDILALDTIDVRVHGALASKGNMSRAIMGELEE